MSQSARVDTHVASRERIAVNRYRLIQTASAHSNTFKLLFQHFELRDFKNVMSKSLGEQIHVDY